LLNKSIKETQEKLSDPKLVKGSVYSGFSIEM